MAQYTIEYDFNKEEDSSYISIPIVEIVEVNTAIGDQIGVYTDGNVLDFDEYINIDDTEIRDFIRENFKDSQSVMGFIRRLTT